MSVLLLTHDRYLEHSGGLRHPERPARLTAVLSGIERAGLGDALVRVEPRPAQRERLTRLHPEDLLDELAALSAAGGGRIDADTAVNAASWEAAVLAAGAGLTAIELLDEGYAGASAAFCAVRPPGHHATPSTAMGFCLLNNVAVTALALADRGERVLIVDYDAHHGNGTQDAFYDDPRVMFVSFHQWPFYPGTGAMHHTGSGAGHGTTMNFPMPAGATGEVYLKAIDEVVAPAVAAFAPTWLLVSAGFDAHRADPLTNLGLTAGDYALLTARILEFAPPGRRIMLLEGGYDLDALALSAAAAVGALAGERLHPERPSSGGPGTQLVDAVAELWHRMAG